MHDYSDVQPVSLNEEHPQLCQILYDDEYRETMGRLLALFQAREYSQRALDLSKKGIALMASHYTLWMYRYQLLCHLDANLYDELDWCDEIALDHEKNYQIWNYRQLILELIVSRGLLSDPRFEATLYRREQPIISCMLESDSKNHHVWLYRKWLVARFHMHHDPAELAFVDKFLALDLHNNSAWLHRFFILFSDRDWLAEEAESEIAHVQRSILTSPHNESAWNYLRGVYKRLGLDIGELRGFCEARGQCVYAIELLADMCESAGDLQQAAQHMRRMASIDRVRATYWEWRGSQLSVGVAC